MPRTPRKPTGKNAPAQVAATPSNQPVLAPSVSLRQLAHELNSLLDGSMRCVGLARTSLQSNAPQDSIDDGLSKAHSAMRHMAVLLERAMKQASACAPSAAIAMFEQQQSIGELFTDLTGLQHPHAHAVGVEITTTIADACAAYPAGPLGPVMMNGLRNAIEAAAETSGRTQSVHLAVRQDGDTLDLTVSGPAGSKSVGRRIGLVLSEQIVRELGGELALMTSDSTTTFRVCVPIANLTKHA